MSRRSSTLFSKFRTCDGRRFGEAAGLDWRDVDLSIGGTTFRDTKNGTNRVVPLPESLVGFLTELRGQGCLEVLFFSMVPKKAYTQPPQPFRDAVEALGLNEGRDKRDRVVFHTLRHTPETRLAQAGTSLPDLQAIGWLEVPSHGPSLRTRKHTIQA